ncbi:hypothetical protein EMEDMD4_310087 [Sinorhizobium medicae]|uniref:Uncharacterized protein n=1 Tax=Sinorhizobium medicae TaxID=110321 RepID=A0A508WWH1_9HYPH|nr:hypothetical protein EMEDMD4_310087 [Sinorhizobium medicae]
MNLMNSLENAALLHVSFDQIRLKDTNCSRSKCYSDLCASDKTHGAAAPAYSMSGDQAGSEAKPWVGTSCSL